MKLTIEKAKEFQHLHEALKKMTSDGWDITKMVCRSYGFIEGWNQAIEKCAGIVDRQIPIDHDSETGGEEELITARNLILSLKVKGESK